MRKRTYKADPRPHSEPARNHVRGVVGPMPESVDMDDDVGGELRKKQALRYFQGRPESGRNKPFLPAELKDNPSGNDLGEVVDLSGRKAPWGGKGKAWADNAGKLGDLDPQEQDQPGWVGTWSPLQEGPNGAGPVRDETYGDQRPRTQSRQEESFKKYNPEFQDVADEGDWTSWKHDSNV